MAKLNINIPPETGILDFDDWMIKTTKYLQDFLGTENYITVTSFENSWVSLESSYVPGYCKDGMGFVHLRGIVKDGTINTVVFTLPVGYRPEQAHYQATSAYSGGYIHAVCSVTANGQITALTSSNAEFSLDGITFYAG
jgi:hypothetical protein